MTLQFILGKAVDHGVELVLFLLISWLIRSVASIKRLPAEVNHQKIIMMDLVNKVEEMRVGIETSIDNLKDRLLVTDRIISDLADSPYDSETIARDATKYPRLRKKKDRDV